MSANPLVVGEIVFIRTVTHYYLGKITELVTAESGAIVPGVLLADCSWVADTRRFGDFLAGKVTDFESEFFSTGVVLVAASTVVDATRWPHALPTTSQ